MECLRTATRRKVRQPGRSDLIQPNLTKKTLTVKYCNDANPDSPALGRDAATPVMRNGKSAKRAVKTQKLNQIKPSHLRYGIDDLRAGGGVARVKVESKGSVRAALLWVADRCHWQTRRLEASGPEVGRVAEVRAGCEFGQIKAN